MGLFAGTKWDVPAHCERCGLLESECQCPPQASPQPTWLEPSRQKPKVALEKRAKGKWVTVVRGLKPSESDLASLCTQLKNACGAGGTLREDHIEIQGDHTARVSDHLRSLGYRI